MNKAVDAFRTISEVASELDIPQHVLRFWETRFSTIRPLKRGGGRRYYRPDDVELLRGIRQLLYGQGYTIKGVQRILKESGPRYVQAIGRGELVAGPMPSGPYDESEESYAPAEDESAYAYEDAQGEAPRDHAPQGQSWAVQPPTLSPQPRYAPQPAPRRPMSDGALVLTPEDQNALREALLELIDCARALDALKQG